MISTSLPKRFSGSCLICVCFNDVECKVPKKGDVVSVLFRYKKIPVIFVYDNNIRKYSLIIEEKSMDNLYDEIFIEFNVDISNKRFCHENNDRSFTSIKDFFMSYYQPYNKIPLDFFEHLSNCVETYWNEKE